MPFATFVQSANNWQKRTLLINQIRLVNCFQAIGIRPVVKPSDPSHFLNQHGVNEHVSPTQGLSATANELSLAYFGDKLSELGVKPLGSGSKMPR